MVRSESAPSPGFARPPEGVRGNLGAARRFLMSLVLVDCGVADLADAQVLSDAAGWNQTADDWRTFMVNGKTLGYRTDEGELVASAAALPYGGAAGWISMVLVAQPWRHQGLATRLLEMCVAHLKELGAIPHLDATPAGMPAYRKLGFLGGLRMARWQGRSAAGADAPADALRRAEHDDLQWMVALDAAANGMDRGFLLQDILTRAGTRAWAMRDGSGFVLRRQGRRASQIGPLIAADEASALLLLQAALMGPEEPVFLDLPERWQQLARELAGRGFGIQRPFVRMALGPAPAHQPGDHLFIVAGPEFG